MLRARVPRSHCDERVDDLNGSNTTGEYQVPVDRYDAGAFRDAAESKTDSCDDCRRRM